MNKRELNDIVISWVTISLAFAMVMSTGIFNIFDPIPRMTSFVGALPITFLAVGTAFIFHELAHRQVARHYGLHAEYRMWKFGLVIALVLGLVALVSNFGFVFAAPGAVYIYGTHIARRENGHISIAGPLTNTIIGIMCMGLIFVLPSMAITGILEFVMFINFLLAFFNMLPVFPLDGSKVFAWSPVIWGIVFFPLALWLFI